MYIVFAISRGAWNIRNVSIPPYKPERQKLDMKGSATGAPSRGSAKGEAIWCLLPHFWQLLEVRGCIIHGPPNSPSPCVLPSVHPFPNFLAFVTTAFLSQVPKSVWVSQDCLKKSLQAEWLETRGIYSLMWEMQSEAECEMTVWRGCVSPRGSVVGIISLLWWHPPTTKNLNFRAHGMVLRWSQYKVHLWFSLGI